MAWRAPRRSLPVRVPTAYRQPLCDRWIEGAPCPKTGPDCRDTQTRTYTHTHEHTRHTRNACAHMVSEQAQRHQAHTDTHTHTRTCTHTKTHTHAHAHRHTDTQPPTHPHPPPHTPAADFQEARMGPLRNEHEPFRRQPSGRRRRAQVFFYRHRCICVSGCENRWRHGGGERGKGARGRGQAGCKGGEWGGVAAWDGVVKRRRQRVA